MWPDENERRAGRADNACMTPSAADETARADVVFDGTVRGLLVGGRVITLADQHLGRSAATDAAPADAKMVVEVETYYKGDGPQFVVVQGEPAAGLETNAFFFANGDSSKTLRACRISAVASGGYPEPRTIGTDSGQVPAYQFAAEVIAASGGCRTYPPMLPAHVDHVDIDGAHIVRRDLYAPFHDHDPVVHEPVRRYPVADCAPGAVVGLEGTPYFWAADRRGVLHWAGDTRALTGRDVRWETRRDVSWAQLLEYNRGAPWLSAGIIVDGGTQYIPAWQSDDAVPRVLRVRQADRADQEDPFGIDTTALAPLTLDRQTWEERFGVSIEGMACEALPSKPITINGRDWRLSGYRSRSGEWKAPTERWRPAVHPSVSGWTWYDGCNWHRGGWTTLKRPMRDQVKQICDFQSAMSRAGRCTLSGAELQILDGQGEVLMTFVPVAAGPAILRGTRWKLMWFEAKYPALGPDKTAYVEFGAKRLRGEVGCSRFSAEYEANSRLLWIEPLEVTGSGCADAAPDDRERSFMANIAGVFTYSAGRLGARPRALELRRLNGFNWADFVGVGPNADD